MANIVFGQSIKGMTENDELFLYYWILVRNIQKLFSILLNRISSIAFDNSIANRDSFELVSYCKWITHFFGSADELWDQKHFVSSMNESSDSLTPWINFFFGSDFLYSFDFIIQRTERIGIHWYCVLICIVNRQEIMSFRRLRGQCDDTTDTRLSGISLISFDNEFIGLSSELINQMNEYANSRPALSATRR